MASDNNPSMTVHEYEVAQMAKGLRPWPKQTMAWINATYEFMQEFGWLTRDGNLTAAGEKAYEDYTTRFAQPGQASGVDSVRS